ncbi:MAG TPA: acetolactate synthase large subunit [Deltaproteobacteria bacterium]|nr:acetolactate synthase large subunit [Deltaproteobacteria bacterium]
MKGAHALVKTLVQLGVDVCFANPGTTEMPLVAAMDAIEGIRPVPCVFEGVCTGAADGFGRMAGRPAMVLLHLGPGLANGIANLHNARRARTPMLVVVGEHATWHRRYDPPLAMDIEALAGTFSGWQRTTARTEDILRDATEAVYKAGQDQVSTLILPYDLQLEEMPEGRADAGPPASAPVDAGMVEKAAARLRKAGRPVLVLGGRALRREGLLTAARISAATGCDLLAETFPARMERGAGLPDVPRIHYLPEMAMDQLSRYDLLIFAGAQRPVSFFGYPNAPAELVDKGSETIMLTSEGRDTGEGLEALASELKARSTATEDCLAQPASMGLPSGPLSGDKICVILAALQPEGCIVVEEAITNSLLYHPLTAGSRPFTLLTLTGGSLGQGPPCAAGAAIACPDRQVISFQADGAALYTLQALWTQARERLNVITLICSNRSYDILRLELARLGVFQPGPSASRLTDLSGVDWVRAGEGMGVPSVSVRTAEDLAREFSQALDEKGPRLIEMVL